MSYRAYQREGFMSLDLCEDHAQALSELPPDVSGWSPVAGAAPAAGCDACSAGGLQDAYLVARQRHARRSVRMPIPKAA